MKEPFVAERPARTWLEFSARRWAQIDIPSSRIGKIALEKFSKENSIPHLRIIKTFSSSSQIVLQDMPDYFVFKPADLWSGAGVMLLERTDRASLWRDARSDKIVNECDIISEAQNLEKIWKNNLRFIIEERAFDEDNNKIIPLDYKVFTFYGNIKFVLQIDRNVSPPSIAFFDGNFSPITDNRVSVSKDKKNTLGEHRKPNCWKEILDLARDVTIKLHAPFISVDCYATPCGPALGELTHTPGGPWYGFMYQFSEAFDRELGAAWQEANSKLGLPEAMIRVPYNITWHGELLRTIA